MEFAWKWANNLLWNETAPNDDVSTIRNKKISTEIADESTFQFQFFYFCRGERKIQEEKMASNVTPMLKLETEI